jgi:hypothetical protein
MLVQGVSVRHSSLQVLAPDRVDGDAVHDAARFAIQTAWVVST